MDPKCTSSLLLVYCFILLLHSFHSVLLKKHPIVSSKLKECDCNQGTIQIQIRESAFNSVFSNSCLKWMSHLPRKSRTEARLVSTKYFCNEIYLPKSHMNPTSCRLSHHKKHHLSRDTCYETCRMLFAFTSLLLHILPLRVSNTSYLQHSLNLKDKLPKFTCILER